MPAPTVPPVPAPYLLLRAALTPPPGLTTREGTSITAGHVHVETLLPPYTQASVHYYLDGVPAATRTLGLGPAGTVAPGPTGLVEGVAIAFEVNAEFRRHGLARALRPHLVRTLTAGNVDRIVVKSDRDGRSAWQRYYEWDYGQLGETSEDLRAALFARVPSSPADAELQLRVRTEAVRRARHLPTVPFRMRALPARRWPGAGHRSD